MELILVCRKRLTDPALFDKAVTDFTEAVTPLGFDSIHPKFTYDPYDKKEGDVDFTSDKE